MSGEFLSGEFQALPKRGIDLETCRKLGYRVGKDKRGNSVQIADYRDADGKLVAQKVRGANKTFSIIGEGKDLPLFGQHLWASSGRRVVVCEGELDALSVAQAAGLTWPVVSVPSGAQSAKKAVQRAIEWLEGFEQVVFCLDNDDPGRTAAVECAALLTPGKAAICELPLKDASDMLVAGKVRELSSALWGARTYRPDGIVSLKDVRDRILQPPDTGFPWFLEGLTKATFGRRPGDVIGIGAGTGCGKTDFMSQQMAFDVMNLGLKIGVIYLEQGVGETGRRLAGKFIGKRLHVPDDGWTENDLVSAVDAIENTNSVFLYDSFGSMDWGTIRSKIRFMVQSLGARVVFLDHMTALCAGEDDERKALDRILSEAAGDAKALGHILIYVSHLATPEGKPHEEGGRVTIRHFRGSRSLGFWSHNLFGIERDTQKPGSPSVLRCLKDRFTGQSNGTLIGMQYDPKTGLLSECELNNGTSDYGFRDETTDF
jgi:twinkle protein